MAAPALFLASKALAQSASWSEAEARAVRLDQLHSLSVAQDGQVQVALRVRGPSLDSPVNVKSVSKTLLSVLTGTAIDRGEITGTGATISQIAPDLIPPGADPRTGDISVENLLSLQAGLERTSGANYGAWVSSRDWVADALSRPMVADPGGPMLYSTGSSHVLGALLSRATGQSLLDLARNRLGQPLDMPFPAWVTDPQGRYLGGNDMATTPSGLLRFAEMIRLGGAYDGSRVVSRAWITDSTTPRTRSRWSGLDYGLGWFLGRSGGDMVWLARGYGGQVVAIVPKQRLSVVITSDPTRPARSAGYFGDLMALLTENVLPAARPG